MTMYQKGNELPSLAHLFLLKKKLETPWNNEENNPFVKLTRIKLLQIFREVASVDSIELFPLHFFTLMELNCARIAMKKMRFVNLFLECFTRDNYLSKSSRKTLHYIRRYLQNRAFKVQLRSKFMKHQYKKLMNGLILKLDAILLCRRPKIVDSIEMQRIWIKRNKLSRYFKWCIDTGAKFTNRVESDYSDYYNLVDSLEFKIHQDEKRTNAQRGVK